MAEARESALCYGADMAVDLQTRLSEGFPNLGRLFLCLFLFHRGSLMLDLICRNSERCSKSPSPSGRLAIITMA
jgi:hypothetical protein